MTCQVNEIKVNFILKTTIFAVDFKMEEGFDGVRQLSVRHRARENNEITISNELILSRLFFFA